MLAETYRKWIRVRRGRVCPICGHDSWCSVSGDGTLTICMRNQVGAIKETKNGGYLHRLKDSPVTGYRVLRLTPRTPPSARFEAMAKQCFAALTDRNRTALAASLGLSAESLVRLRVGWSAEHTAYTFPMRNSAGGIIGMRLRRPNGSKYSVTGSKSGIFIPADTSWSGTLLITEGPTDCAALLDLGFTCIGRPDCQSCVALVAELVRQRQYGNLVVVGDGDAPGQRGAVGLASTLVLYHPCVRIITPPAGFKDARAWKVAGATREDVQELIDVASIQCLHIASKYQAQGAGHE